MRTSLLNRDKSFFVLLLKEESLQIKMTGMVFNRLAMNRLLCKNRSQNGKMAQPASINTDYTSNHQRRERRLVDFSTSQKKTERISPVFSFQSTFFPP